MTPGRRRFLVMPATLMALVVVCLVVPQLLSAASLDELIAKAKQEESLNAHVVSGITRKTQAKLIKKEDLPKAHAELTDPKYKDKWIQPPYAAHWDIGPLAFPDIPQPEWIELVRKGRKVDVPGFRLHRLKGGRKGEFSIWVSGNWRVTFDFEDGNAYIVNYEDYH